MLDPFDYKEPSCAVCGGKEFYYPEKDSPEGHIPVERVIEKLDKLFDKNDMSEAGRLLKYWQGEAVALKDRRGELAMTSELIGFYRKTGERENALVCVERGLSLLEELGLGDSVSGATILLNAATTLMAFGQAERALPLYERTEKIYRARLSPEDARFGGLYNNRALALHDLGNFEDSEKCFFQALEIMGNIEHGETDMAVTYVNLAHLYEDWLEEPETKIDECMNRALALLDTESLPRNGYYAFVCSKCAPSFGYFGYFLADRELKKRAEELYARA